MNLSTLKRKDRKETWAWILATWFGSGCAPKAPGTVGSFFALPLVLIGTYLGTASLFFVTIFLFGLGLWATDVVLKKQQKQDPGFVVIDEVVGQTITFLLLVSATVPLYVILTGFLLFRLFDIWKPWPVSYFDQKVHNAFGVMMDDVVAGIYAAILLYGLTFLI